MSSGSRLQLTADLPPTIRIMLASRPGFFASGRIMSRICQVVSPAGAATTTGRRCLAAAYMVGDIALTWWFLGRGSDDRRCRFRLFLDTADSVVWSCLAPDTDFATLITMVQTAPLAAELGFTRRTTGVALALIPSAGALLVRRSRGQSLRIGQATWPLVSALPGVFVTKFDRWFYRRAADAEAKIAARVAQARRVARADLSLVGHTVIDDLRHAAFVIESLTGTATEWRGFSEIKQREIMWANQDERRFLRDALEAWARRQTSPDLQSQAVFTMNADDGLFVIDREQYAALEAILDEMRPGGDVTVDVVRRTRWGWAATDAVLHIDGRVVTLPGPPSMQVKLFDGAVITQSLTAVFMMMPMVEDNGAAAWWSCVPTAVATAAHAVWVGTRGRSEQRSNSTTSLVLAAASLLLHTPLVSRSMRCPHSPDGLSRFPFRFALFGFHMIVGLHAQPRSRTTGAAVAATSLAAVCAAWFSTPPPRNLRVLVTEVIGSLPGLGVALSIRAATEELEANLSFDADAVRSGIHAERDEMFGYLSDRLMQLDGVLQDAQEPHLVDSVRPLLDNIRKQIDALMEQSEDYLSRSWSRTDVGGRRDRSSSRRRSAKSSLFSRLPPV